MLGASHERAHSIEGFFSDALFRAAWRHLFFFVVTQGRSCRKVVQVLAAHVSWAGCLQVPGPLGFRSHFFFHVEEEFAGPGSPWRIDCSEALRSLNGMRGRASLAEPDDSPGFVW